MGKYHTKLVKVSFISETNFAGGPAGAEYSETKPVEGDGANMKKCQYFHSAANLPLREYERRKIDGPSLQPGQQLVLNEGFVYKDAVFPMFHQSVDPDWLREILKAVPKDESWVCHQEYDNLIIDAFGTVPQKYNFKAINAKLSNEDVEFYYWSTKSGGNAISHANNDLDKVNVASGWNEAQFFIDGAQICNAEEFEVEIERIFEDAQGCSGNRIDPLEIDKKVSYKVRFRGDSPLVKHDLSNETVSTYTILLYRDPTEYGIQSTSMFVSESITSEIPDAMGYFYTDVTFEPTAASTHAEAAPVP